MKELFFCLLLIFSQNILKAQLSEDFSDGDFIADPVWVGNDTSFKVNDDLQLQLDEDEGGESYLSTAISIDSDDETTWEFYTRLAFSPSTNNQFRFYLSSDIEDLAGNVNGYVLLVGESLSEDVFSLYRVDDGVETELVQFASLGAQGSSSEARVRVTRSSSGMWTLNADFEGTSCFELEATATDNNHPTGNYIGVKCKYTGGNATKFYVDDVYVDAAPEAEALGIESIVVIDDMNIDVIFNQFVDITTANINTNYQIFDENGSLIGTASSAVVDGTDQRIVHLTFSVPFGSEEDLTLIVENLLSCSGAAIGSDNSGGFTYYEVVPAGPKDIIITEIMADTSPDDNDLVPSQGFAFDKKYVELYNRTTSPINLEGLIFGDVSSVKILPEFTLLGNQYVILCEDDDIAQFSPFGDVIGIASLPTPNVTEDVLKLENDAGVVIDEVAYTDDWYNDEDRNGGGWSLELVNPNLICEGITNWRASIADIGGTPGSENSNWETTEDTTGPTLLNVDLIDENSVILFLDASAENPAFYSIDSGVGAVSESVLLGDGRSIQLTINDPAFSNATTYTVEVAGMVEDCYGNALSNNSIDFTYYDFGIPSAFDILITEVMANSDADVGTLPDVKYVELFNRTDFAIQLETLNIEDSNSSASFTSKVIIPGEYLIVCKDTDVDMLSSYGNVLGLSSFPSPNNDGDIMRITDLFGNTIHGIEYNNSWYQDSDKDDGGWSLEMINPGLFCEQESNWRASVDPSGGTPGQENSVIESDLDASAPVMLNAVPPSNSTLLVTFDEFLDVSASNNALYSISPNVGPVTNVQLQTDGKSLLISINAPFFQEGTTYTLSTTDGVEDCYGNALNDVAFTFDYFEFEAAERYDIIFNEIFSDPKVSLGLPEMDFVELYNRSEKVINLENYLFIENFGSPRVLPFYRLMPGAYVVIHPKEIGESFESDVPVIVLEDFPDLNVDGNVLELLDANDEVINNVFYSSVIYNNPSSANGRTMELINPSAPCVISNWRQSENLIGGTPGRQNSVYNNEPDEAPLDLIRAFPLDENSVRLYFNKAVDGAFANDNTMFTIDNGIGNPIVTIEDGFFFTSILLELGQDLQPNTTYTVTLDGTFQDCIGNTVGQFDSARFGLPEAFEPNDVVINEFMFYPNSGDDVRWIEIYNRSNKILNLDSLNIRRGLAGATGVVLEPYILLPQEYAVLAPSPFQVNQSYFAENPFNYALASMPAFDDKVDSLLLYSRSGEIIDQLFYDDTFHNGLIDNERGVSIERINPEAPTQDSENWHSAAEKVGWATPTYKNSQFFVGENTANDIINIPNVSFSPDGDGFEDFLFINYITETAGYVANVRVYDAEGRLIKELAENELLLNEGNFKWDGDTEDGSKARLGIYVVYIELFNPDGDVQVFKKNCVVAGQF